jgi:hypothetical protein
MAILRIDSCKVSKSGKSLNVQSGVSWYLAKLDSGIDKLVGQTIDCETNTSNYNGQDLTWIGVYKVYAQAPSHVSETREPVQQVSNGDHMRYMPFISNTVAHLIAAGQIKDTASLETWALAAYGAALKVEDTAEMRKSL